MTALTAQLHAIRRERKMSLNTLSGHSGYDRFTISRWERGRPPSLPRFVDWAAALGYDVALVPRTETEKVTRNGAGMVARASH